VLWRKVEGDNGRRCCARPHSKRSRDCRAAPRWPARLRHRRAVTKRACRHRRDADGTVLPRTADRVVRRSRRCRSRSSRDLMPTNVN
jgi:hypothetical protein